MGSTVFMPEGTELVNGKLVPKTRAAWRHRTDGQNTSKKVWLCKACWAWHDAPKPPLCQVCDHKYFFYHDSAGEARWFAGRLRAMERGEIADLIHHPIYEIWLEGPHKNMVKVFNYEADAEYVQAGKVVTGDFKPKAKRGLDPVFNLKRKCFEAQYGRQILIVYEQ